jgi:hypothetical protein
VSAGQDRHRHYVDVFLHRGGHDHLGRLVETGVHDLEPRIAKRTRDDLSSTIVPIEPRLGDQDPDLSFV